MVDKRASFLVMNSSNRLIDLFICRVQAIIKGLKSYYGNFLEGTQIPVGGTR